MLDAKSLLEHFIGQPAGDMDHAPKQAGSNGLGNLKGLAGSPGGTAAGTLATGALAGGLIGLLVGGKKPKKIARSALKLGGAALVGGLAYKAYRDWTSNKPVPFFDQGHDPLPVPSHAFSPSAPDQQQALCMSLIRAMVSAAKADGHISEDERHRISTHLAAFPLGAEERSFLERELAGTIDIDAVADAAQTPEQAAEIYAASLLAIDADGTAERGYLAMLAARLRLDPDLVRHLHANADALVEPVPA